MTLVAKMVIEVNRIWMWPNWATAVLATYTKGEHLDEEGKGGEQEILFRFLFTFHESTLTLNQSITIIMLGH